ncbi:MAG TPA: hypothetical protein IAC41_03385 [Candidatus Merdenecus merdavium]|nr:hypothetical protein [Candidatus Merdenecus merdavium]
MVVAYANRLIKKLEILRKHGYMGYLEPDGKAQVNVTYDQQGKLQEITTIVLWIQYEAGVNIQQIRNDLYGVIHNTFPRHLLKNTKIYLNPGN